jgi:hypothetical protein
MAFVSRLGMFGMIGGAVAIFCVAPALAKDAPQPRPEVFRKLIDCRTVADNVARLACYDAQVARLDEAESRNEVVVVDKEQVKKARKGLFGLSLPDLGGVFGTGDDNEDKYGLSEIQSTVKAAVSGTSGKWTIILEDGAKWVQTDTTAIRTPKAGQPIIIKKGALGSFVAKVNDLRAFKVIRVN